MFEPISGFMNDLVRKARSLVNMFKLACGLEYKVKKEVLYVTEILPYYPE